ncbi:4'-phosphopantetheinyl transferase family protein [Streptomyces sp. NPDC060223]|uniref:4'-phosphopantetheinyl transferase family protein n=1 Tax=unclassified Streptomyces TaxID=2593676 RepID=UPI003641F658
MSASTVRWETRLRTAAEGVHYLVARNEEILETLPVAAMDQAAASDLPPWRAVEHAASRTLLRALLREIGEDIRAGPVAARRSGRPYLPDRPGLGVSLSHSSGWAAAAVGRDRDVGIDVQIPSRVSDRMLRFCCSPEDAETLALLPEDRRRREFAWIFTAKEACVKAVGTGLSGRPWIVPVTLGQRTGHWEHVHWSAPRHRRPVPLSCAWTERPARDGESEA